MRALVTLALLALVGCGARPVQIAVRTPARTVDDRVEMSFECTRTRRRCERGDCAMVRVPASCPSRSLTMRGDTGAVVHAVLLHDGVISAVVHSAAAPAQTWRVESAGLPIGTTRTRSYRQVTGLVDGMVLFTVAAGALLVQTDEHQDLGERLLIAAAVLYPIGTPIAHAANGNGGQGWRSLGRRMSVPAVFALVAAAQACDGFEGEGDDCVLRPLLGGLLGTVISAPVFMIWDHVRSEVTTGLPLVTPTVSAGRDGTTFGLAGRF